MKGVYLSQRDFFSLLAGFSLHYKCSGMDPLSILAGVLGVTAITAESAKRLCELLDAVRSAPNEIKNISRDTQAFYSILFSLESSLRDAEVTAVIARDENLTALVGNLEGPLKNCRSVLGQLMVKIQGFVRPLDEEGWRMSSNVRIPRSSVRDSRFSLPCNTCLEVRSLEKHS